MPPHKLTGTVIAQKANRALRQNSAMRELMRQIVYEENPRTQAMLLSRLAHLLGDQFGTLTYLNSELKEARE